MICVSLTGQTTEAMLSLAERAAEKGADLVEFRLDYLAEPDVAQLVAQKPLPAIFTCRPVREGGRFEGAEADRIALLQQAMDAGADYVDVELDAVGKIERKPNVTLIVSLHDFERTPDDLDALYRTMTGRPSPDVVKIATTATDVGDNFRLFDLLKRATVPTIALAMGERGVGSRILARKFGGLLTFASLEEGAGSAPGQLTIDALTNLYRYRSINADTEVFGVAAKPVAHSMSPLIHNTAFAELGLDAVYVPFLVDDITDFLKRSRPFVRGYSVTLPHKEEAFRNADEVDDLTRKIGSLNTLVAREGKLVGTNTDITAAIGAMEDALGGKAGDASPLAGRKVALVGVRGTARAVGFGLVDAGAEVTIYNRTIERAATLAKELGCEWAGLDELPSASADVIANTTSVGMHPNVDASVVPTALLREGILVFDAVYNPIETKLIREARERKCLTVTGLEMFVRQASEQFNLFTDLEPPVNLMRRVVEDRLTG